MKNKNFLFIIFLFIILIFKYKNYFNFKLIEGNKKETKEEEIKSAVHIQLKYFK